jgi:hypothetical protein
MGEVRVAYNILVGRPEGRRPQGRPRCRWEDNIKMDLREIGFGNVDWIHLAQDRDRWWALVNTVMNSKFVGKLGRNGNNEGKKHLIFSNKMLILPTSRTEGCNTLKI